MPSAKYMRVELFIPTSITPWLRTCLDQDLIERCGGFTKLNSVGGYLRGDGYIDVEVVDYYIVLMQDDDATRMWFENLMFEFHAENGQDCTMYIINGNNPTFLKGI